MPAKLSHRNLGAVTLARKSVTQEAIAARIGCSRTIVAYWLSGQRKPSPEYRVALKRVYGIPIEAWGQPVVPEDVTKGKRKASADQPVSVEQTMAELTVRERTAWIKKRLDALVQKVESDHDATPLELAKVMASAAVTLKLLGTMTGEAQEVNESKILRLPAWHRIQETIVQTLTTKWPEALTALGDALQELGGESWPT